MRITLLSDSHGPLASTVLDKCQGSDEIWHAGDLGSEETLDQMEALGPVRAVYGNIDGHQIRARVPEHQRFEVEHTRVWITHIGGYPGRYDRRLRQSLHAQPPDLFICGHSHILKVMYDKKLQCLHLNPGAIGNQGFHQKKTLLRFTLKAGKVQDLEVVEYDRRV